MENYTANKIREEFMAPLMLIAAEFAEEAKKLEKLIESGECPKDFIPLNVASARKGIGFLKKLRREIGHKLEGVKDGTFLWRESVLARQREKYRELKETSEKAGTKRQKK